MHELAHIRAITLDLDDTLWPIAPVIVRAEQGLQDWLIQHAPRTAVLSAEQRHACRRAVNAAHPQMQHDLSFLRREAIRACLLAAGDDPALAEPAFEVFFALRQQVTFHPGKLDALARLAARYRLVALSNGNADIFRTEAAPYFHAAISAREFGVAKPDPRIFHAAAQAAGVGVAEVLHVGDDSQHDVEGARHAGMAAAWITPADSVWTHGEPAPLRFVHLADLCDHLKA
jgi:HAD superfamily hydrolase (TIGR01549 family)